MDFIKKTVLVTGSAKGIGKELIIKFAKLGSNVIIVYNESKKEALDLEKEIKEKYLVNVLVLKCNIINENEIINMRDKVLEKYNKIDILINNAAYASDNYIDEKTKEEFMKVLEVNVVGTFLITKYFYKYITTSIVNISSTDACDTYSTINMDYSASKAAINSLTKSFALEFKNIKVLGVMPNWTDTESIRQMNPNYLKEELKRINQKELQDPKIVAGNIIELIKNPSIKSGSIERV